MRTYIKTNPFVFLMGTLLLLGTSGNALRAQEIRTERVSFQRGASSATIEGRISDYETVDYLLNVQAGQSMNISMATNNTQNYFNIMEPGEEYEAIHVGSTVGNQYEGTTAKSGDYRIRVYLMRPAAQRGEQASYRMEMIVSGGGSAPRAAAGSHPYDPSGGVYTASGYIKCWNNGQNPDNQCPMGVIRRSGGDADVYVKRPDGSERVIYFQNGKAVGYDHNQGDHGEFSASVGGDTWLIMIGNERYEIVEAIIYGG